MLNIGMMNASHRRFSAALDAMVAKTLSEQNSVGVAEARSEIQSGHVKTGKLLRTTKGKLFRLGATTVSRISTTAEHAKYFESGTKRHWIYPRRARFLRFIGKRDGAVVYATRVDHPGNRPYFVLGAAWWKMAVRTAAILRGNMQYLAQTKFK